MPPDHQQYIAWNGTRFIQWAEQVGENTAAIVRLFLGSRKVEQQSYKSCMALLKLTDKYPPQRLESACAKAFSFSTMPSRKSIQSILKSGQDKLLNKETDTKKSVAVSEYGFTRGAAYYAKEGDKC